MAEQIDFSSVAVGDIIPPIRKKVNQKIIDAYAEASGDYNPIHVDPEFAKDTIFKGTIAHGLLTLSYISQMMVKWAGKYYLENSSLETTFLSPVRPGDEVIIKGEVSEILEKDGKKEIICQVYCDGENGQRYISGKATITLQ
ncbi:MAG: MaoC family dehydratase [Dethiobacteria bacterium]|jgi:3-hydroxybutyryl-CoA dehydratase